VGRNEFVGIQVTNGASTSVVQALDRNLLPYYVIVSTSEGNNSVSVVEDSKNPAKTLAIYGGQADDKLSGGSAVDSIYGLGGSDSIHGGASGD